MQCRAMSRRSLVSVNSDQSLRDQLLQHKRDAIDYLDHQLYRLCGEYACDSSFSNSFRRSVLWERQTEDMREQFRRRKWASAPDVLMRTEQDGGNRTRRNTCMERRGRTDTCIERGSRTDTCIERRGRTDTCIERVPDEYAWLVLPMAIGMILGFLTIVACSY